MVSAAATAPAPQPQPPRQQEVLAQNAERLMKIGSRIRALVRAVTSTGALPSPELTNLVFALARGIDFAISAGDVPTIAGEMPSILRKIYELRKEPSVRSSVMVLVISCKNACSNKWFQHTDSVDILRMANELSGSFCTSLGEAANDITVLRIISEIMPRYYPQLKFERLVTSMEAKVGYGVLMSDFFIERNLLLEEKIRLIVVQKGSLDASSCIRSPPHVSFLVNGKGVDMRTNVSMETGPQFPTDITKMVKYGANIIQAVGCFTANYIIAVAFMKSSTSFSPPTLDDYSQPVTADPADSDVLEGPSRVSLKCPISLRRIKIPIKGHLCKHYQCFDYDNYIEMNLIKPTWRCPYCNTPSNFMELHIDQKIAKILQETRDDVLDILLFADGSWKAAQVNNEKSDRDTVDAVQQTGDTVQTDSSSSHVIDLVNENGDDLPMNWASALEDTKPVLNCQDLSMLDYLPDLPTGGPVHAGQTNSNIISTSPQTLLKSSSSGLVSSSFGTLEPFHENVLQPTVTDAVCPLRTSSSTSEMVQMQPQTGPLHGSEVSKPISRNTGSEAVGVQEFPVPPQNSGSSRRLQSNILHCSPPVPNPTSTYQAHQVTNPSSVIAPVNNDGGTLPRAPSAAPLLHQLSTTLDMRSTSSHLPRRVVGLLAPHLMGSRQSAALPRSFVGANAYISMPVLNELMSQNRVNQTAQPVRGQTSSAASIRPIQADIQRHASRPRTVPQAATPVLQAPLHQQSRSEPTGALSTPQAGASDSLPELPVNENWRPTGQMRGSLTGNAYNHAIERYLGQATQPQSQARPPSASDGKRPH